MITLKRVRVDCSSIIKFAHFFFRAATLVLGLLICPTVPSPSQFRP